MLYYRRGGLGGLVGQRLWIIKYGGGEQRMWKKYFPFCQLEFECLHFLWKEWLLAISEKNNSLNKKTIQHGRKFSVKSIYNFYMFTYISTYLHEEDLTENIFCEICQQKIMREFLHTFSVRAENPEHFLPTRLAGWSTFSTSGRQFKKWSKEN